MNERTQASPGCDNIVSAEIGLWEEIVGALAQVLDVLGAGMHMVWLRLFALVVEGGPPSDGSWKLLFIDKDDARLEPAGDLVGLGLEATGERLRERFGDKVAISAIGPGGELLYRTAGITHMDNDRHLTRISARGGLGAVMGSKRLKAVVFDQPEANRPDVVDPELFKATSKRYIKALQEHPLTSVGYPVYGTAGMVNLCNTVGGLPTRNFSAGRFEGAEAISGETIHDLNKSRGGNTTHACMPGMLMHQRLVRQRIYVQHVNTYNLVDKHI